jgi:hypothetical protein
MQSFDFIQAVFVVAVDIFEANIRGVGPGSTGREASGSNYMKLICRRRYSYPDIPSIIDSESP